MNCNIKIWENIKIILFILHLLISLIQAVRIGPLIKNALRRDGYLSENYHRSVHYQDSYLVENHDVTTKDGYILRLNRILPNNATKNSCKDNLPPVYLFHGLLESAEIWWISGPGRALGYLLSDQGYDVWLGNARGTTHSRRHTNLTPDEREFWDFTWHEIGIYDNPANIDYILKKTGQKQLHYIGHSQGTTTFFVMTSMLPEYNAKIKTMHALAPVTFMKYTTSRYFTLPAPHLRAIDRISTRLGLEEYFPNTHIFSEIQKHCKINNPSLNLCFQLLAIGGGTNPKQMNTEALYKFFYYAPAGASIYQALHYSQLFLNGKFQSYNYGKNENYKRYGQTTPIEYPLNKVTMSPIYLYVSGNDPISSLRDTKLLISKLPKKPVVVEVADKQWTHFDYLIGKYAKELVYDWIISYMQSFDFINCGKRKL